MTFRELRIGDFFHYDNSVFMKIYPIRTETGVMNAIAIRHSKAEQNGNLWHIHSKISVDKVSEV